MTFRNGTMRTILALIAFAVFWSAGAANRSVPWGLTCERVVDPVGVDVPRPRLSWRLPDGVKAQTAYEIEADGWSSGRVASSSSLDITWDGGRLPSSSAVNWRVRIWDENGRASGWSGRARFVAGVTDPDGWGAKWIAGAAETRPEVDFGNARWIEGKVFRRKFTYPGTGVCDFVVCSTEPGRVYLNGDEVAMSGGHFYDGRFARFIDLTGKIRKGKNELRIVLRDEGRPAVVKNVRESGVSAILGVIRNDRKPADVTCTAWGGRELGAFREPSFAKGLVTYEELASPAFRRCFVVRKGLRRAVLHVSGVGFCEAWINGAKVGTKVLDPSPTDYDDRVLYSTYELEHSLQSGTNELVLLVGHGWYDMRSTATWNFDAAPWRNFPRAIARLDLEYSDGVRERIVTDSSWDQIDSPVVYDCVREGEVTGWRRPGLLRVPAGLKAAVVSGPRGRLEAETMPGATVVEELKPVKIADAGQGRSIVSFAKEIAGWARLDLRGLARGDAVSIRYDEKLKPDGSATDPRRPCPDWDWNADDRMIDMYFRRAGSAHFVPRGDMQIDHFISSGAPLETHEPRFVWHGFRHLVIDGLKAPLKPEDVTAKSVRTGFAEIGEFSCSDGTLNALVGLAKNSYCANFTAGYPTDCPTREKLGWTGDAWIASEMAQYFYENTAAYEKWLRDIIDTQLESGELCCIAPTSGWGFVWGNGPVFDVVLAMLPWNLWMYRGDFRALELVYEPLKRYLAYERTRETAPDLVANGLGDWNAKVESRKPSDELVISCMYLRAREIAAEIARLKGLDAEAAAFAAAAGRTRTALRRKYVKADGVVDNAGQTAQALAVMFGLYSDAAEKARIGEKLVRAVETMDRHIDFGLVGAKYVYRALSEIGRADLAYRMIVNRTEPSMVKWLGQEGTGCLWEDFGTGLSKCHVMLSDFAAWSQEYLVGMRPVEHGFRRIRIKPHPIEGVDWAKGATETPYGRLAAEWKIDGNTFACSVDVPAACTAEVILPDGSRQEVGPGRRSFAVRYGRAKWISPSGSGGRLATAELRRETVNADRIVRATWTMSGLGVYEARVNGRTVSGFLEPGFTDAVRCRHEFVHDVTGAFDRDKGATNQLEASVSHGWWSDKLERSPAQSKRRGHADGVMTERPAFRGELKLEYENRTVETVPTDETWLASWRSRTTLGGIYEGEDVDFRIRNDGRSFAPAVENRDFHGEIRPARNVPAVRREDLALPVKDAWVWRGVEGAEGTNAHGRVKVLRHAKDGEAIRLVPGENLVVDFGQNAAFVPDVTFSGSSGVRVTLAPGEMLNDGNGRAARGNDGPEGSVLRANYRWARSQANVTLSGSEKERYVPRFTYFGGRYLAITSNAPVVIERIKSVPVTSIRKEDERGTLKTGHPRLNRLVENVKWGMYSNYLSVPTDCPQRDERLGWTADADIFAETATYRADVKDFLSKYLADLRDGVDANGVYPAVGPIAFLGPQKYKFGWTDAGVLIAHKLWWRYGDRTVIDENWAAMERYVRFVASFGGRTEFGKDWQYGDWLSFEKYESHQDWFRERQALEDWWNYLGGCYLLRVAEAMDEMAKATGRKTDALYFGKLVRATRDRLRKDCFDADGLVDRRYRDLQTAHVFALACGLVEGAARTKTVECLVSLLKANGDRLKTGFLGTPLLLKALSDNGRTDYAYTLLLQPECPGWLFQVDQGATTIWERWNSYTKKDGFADSSMNSFNHYAYGCVLGWLFETAAGIRPTAPGYASYVIDPHPDPRLGSLEARFTTPSGKDLHVSWSYGPDGTCRIER